MRPFLPLLILALAASTAQAAGLAGGATPVGQPLSTLPEGPLTAPLGQAIGITLPRAVKDVALGSEDIISVNVVNGRTLVVSGRKFGLTNLLAYDDNGIVIFNRQIAVPAAPPNSVSIYDGGKSRTLICTPLCADQGSQAAAAASAAVTAGATATGATP